MSISSQPGKETTGAATSGVWRARAVNGWPLFWLLTLPMTAFLVMGMNRYDLNSPDGVSAMIGYSVRWAVPFIYWVIAAWAMPVLFPSEFTRWWLRSRKFVGLVFAVAMAWQGAFIFIMSNLHTGYYYEEVYYLRDELEGTSGYLFLAAMVITSFRFGRQFVSTPQWKVIHRCGLYFLWAYPFSVYWWNLFYYGNAETHDYIFYGAGFLAFAVRIAAWAKKRQQAALQQHLEPVGGLARAAGSALIITGLLGAATGNYWYGPVNGLATFPEWSAQMELWLPFYPLEPFLPLLMMAMGAWIYTGVSASHPQGMPATSSNPVA